MGDPVIGHYERLTYYDYPIEGFNVIRACSPDELLRKEFLRKWLDGTRSPFRPPRFFKMKRILLGIRREVA